jgi:hypothetical protein
MRKENGCVDSNFYRNAENENDFFFGWSVGKPENFGWPSALGQIHGIDRSRESFKPTAGNHDSLDFPLVGIGALNPKI